MGIEKIQNLTIVRHATDPLISVYRDEVYLGAVYPPVRNGPATFDVNHNVKGRASFGTEAEAIAFFSPLAF